MGWGDGETEGFQGRELGWKKNPNVESCNASTWETEAEVP